MGHVCKPCIDLSPCLVLWGWSHGGLALVRNCRHSKPRVCAVTSSTHWCCGCVYGGDKCFCNGSCLPAHSAPSVVPVGETTALAVPNSAGLSQTTSLEREQADTESCLGKISPGSGSLCETRHSHVARLSTGGLILHRGEGLVCGVPLGWKRQPRMAHIPISAQVSAGEGMGWAGKKGG